MFDINSRFTFSHWSPPLNRSVKRKNRIERKKRDRREKFIVITFLLKVSVATGTKNTNLSNWMVTKIYLQSYFTGKRSNLLLSVYIYYNFSHWFIIRTSTFSIICAHTAQCHLDHFRFTMNSDLICPLFFSLSIFYSRRIHCIKMK